MGVGEIADALVNIGTDENPPEPKLKEHRNCETRPFAARGTAWCTPD